MWTNVSGALGVMCSAAVPLLCSSPPPPPLQPSAHWPVTGSWWQTMNMMIPPISITALIIQSLYSRSQWEGRESIGLDGIGENVTTSIWDNNWHTLYLGLIKCGLCTVVLCQRTCFNLLEPTVCHSSPYVHIQAQTCRHCSVLPTVVFV